MPPYTNQMPNAAGYIVDPHPVTPPTPWYYEAENIPAQIASYLPVHLFSYLPPVWTLRHG